MPRRKSITVSRKDGRQSGHPRELISSLRSVSPTDESKVTSIIINSASIRGSLSPINSTLIWLNCLNLPFCGRSRLNMGPIVKSRDSGSLRCILCSIYARITDAVASGRRVRYSFPRSRNVYISFSTMSVVSPIPLANNSVFSSMGILISRIPKLANISRALFSTKLHFPVSPGRISLNPRTAVIFSISFTSVKSF